MDKEKEYEETISKFNGVISKICYYFSTDKEEFKDLRQEVLYNIWRGWDNFRNDSKLSTWIYRISFNTCVSYQRKEKKIAESLSIEDVVDLPDEMDNNQIEKYNLMHAMIQKLNFEERSIILLWLDEKSYDEIAELVGLKRNTLASKIKRIKEKLINMGKNF